MHGARSTRAWAAVVTAWREVHTLATARGSAQSRTSSKVQLLNRLNAELASRLVQVQTMPEVDVDALMATSVVQQQYRARPGVAAHAVRGAR